ncbi:MAG TPA: hypothetical protein VNQ80_08495 [Parapedobacter sp.]|uniref:hypothetical protein n=1 Tax=Parapedobacter sp. TaxID=1958893 RepID=UPI002B522B63|nr:hypothetical protein [Parapedobacter sp.]HWK57362.1 hypothetical protein [Parapedobacter sp.]
MKTIKMLFAILAATVFLAACNNTGNNQQQDTDTTYVEPVPPANDTLMNDTM